ncbi:MAG: hypothetical protein IT389_11000 [Nitrospira sp.]|nr:hypothetical protein [Nitrospira sp.]
MLRSRRCVAPFPSPAASIARATLAILTFGGFAAFGEIGQAETWQTGAAPAANALPAQTPRSSKTASPHIGSAMAVLATLQDAEVLPPENTPDANRIIRFVIQFQSVFTKSDDPAVQAFARHALAPEDETRAADIVSRLRATGWTAEALERLSDEEARRSPEEMQRLAQGFAPFNLSVADFHRFMQLVQEARQAFRARGLEFQQIFSSRRKEMPGAGTS